MKTTFAAIAASITLTTLTLTPIQASAGISTLGGCYDAVITWCNNTHPEHASACAGGGMDECDEEFGNAMAGPGFDKIKVQPKGDGTFKFRLIRAFKASPQSGRANDSDSDRDAGRDAGRGGKSAGR